MKKIPKQSGFKTPPGYFEGISERIKERMNSEILPNISTDGGFKVPDGYFETVSKDIIEKAHQEKTPVIQLKPYRSYLYLAAGIAAIFIIVIGLRLNNTASISFDELADTDIASYFEWRDSDLSSYEIAEMVHANNLDLNEFMETEVADDEIIDYLEYSIDDLNELNIDLNEDF